MGTDSLVAFKLELWFDGYGLDLLCLLVVGWFGVGGACGFRVVGLDMLWGWCEVVFAVPRLI